jgi:hypothetical protein
MYKIHCVSCTYKEKSQWIFLCQILNNMVKQHAGTKPKARPTGFICRRHGTTSQQDMEESHANIFKTL